MFRDLGRTFVFYYIVGLSIQSYPLYKIHRTVNELYFKDIAQVFYHAYKSDPYNYPFLELDYFEYLLDMHESAPLTLHTVIADEKVVGAIIGYPLGSYLSEGFSEKTYATLKAHNIKTEDLYYLAELVILPEYQKKGLSKFLLHSFYESVRELGYGHIIAAVIDNKKNKLLNYYYEHIGFGKTPYCFDLTWTSSIGSTMQDQTHTICLWEKVLNHKVN